MKKLAITLAIGGVLLFPAIGHAQTAQEIERAELMEQIRVLQVQLAELLVKYIAFLQEQQAKQVTATTQVTQVGTEVQTTNLVSTPHQNTQNIGTVVEAPVTQTTQPTATTSAPIVRANPTFSFENVTTNKISSEQTGVWVATLKIQPANVVYSLSSIDYEIISEDLNHSDVQVYGMRGMSIVGGSTFNETSFKEGGVQIGVRVVKPGSFKLKINNIKTSDDKGYAETAGFPLETSVIIVE